jgi:NAD(P)H-flavin reductase
MADEFKSLTVREAWDEGPHLRGLRLDVGGSGYRESFLVPGQYVRVRPAGAPKDLFLALANAPGDEDLELLIQHGVAAPAPASGAAAPLADLLAAAKAGDRLEVTAPAGKGFPVDGERGRDVLLLAGGSGISAIRSALEHVVKQRDDFGRAVLLFGARREDDLAYRRLFERWEGHRIDVEPTLSQPEGSAWLGRVGYVTVALADLGLDPQRTSVFLAGGKEFLAASTASLIALGLAPSRIFRNF